MDTIIAVLTFLYSELFLGGLEAAGLIIDHTKDGLSLRMNAGKGLIPRSPIAMALATGVTPLFFTDSPQLRDIYGEPVMSSGDRTWMQIVSLQIALRYAGMGKTHEQLEKRLNTLSKAFGLQLPVMGPKAYAAELEEAAKHPGEYKYIIFPGNALGGGKGMPVAYMGYIKDFARVWRCDGVKARKLVLSFCKWGQPGSTQATGETRVLNGRDIECAIVAEDLMEYDGWDLHTKQHDGIFFFNWEKIQFKAARYLSTKFHEYRTVMLRYRTNNPLDVWKGLGIFLDGKDFSAKAKEIGVSSDVDMITSAGNIKQGGDDSHRTASCDAFDFLNLTSQWTGGMSIGRQLNKAGINQRAAYDLYTFCRKNSFKYIPFLDSMTPVYKDPLDVFIMALKDDYEAIMNILMSVDMISFKDCVSLVKRNLFVRREAGQRPKILKYKTNYNSIAPKLTSFFSNYVLKAHGRIPLAYIMDNANLDVLRQQVWAESKVRVNPYIPHIAKRRYIKHFLTTIGMDARGVLEKQPVVGAASIQASDFVVRDKNTPSGYRMWDRTKDSIDDIAYSKYCDEVTCVMLQQMPADCDGDQIAFAMYPAAEGNEFERCPVFDWTSITGKKKGELPETEDEMMDTYLGVIAKMRSTIGIVDNIMTRFGCKHILNGTTMPVKESMKMALAFEYWVIKEQMRPGGKGESQDDAITKLVDTFMGGREPKTTSIFRFSKDDQGVGYAEGHARVVNWILINARNVVKRELPKIHAKGGIFMYQDVAERINKEFPEGTKWDQVDNHSLLAKADFDKAFNAVTKPGAEVFISHSTLNKAETSAETINDTYSTKSTNIMDNWRAGKLTKAEKEEAFNKLMGDELAPYLEDEIMTFVRTQSDNTGPHMFYQVEDGVENTDIPSKFTRWTENEDGTIEYHYIDWMVHRRFERALCIQMGRAGFLKAGTNGGFAFHCSPPTVAFVAGLAWPENPIIKRLTSFSTAAKNYHGEDAVPTASTEIE